jgi:RNA polymerase sigma-70 factor (ECF subfamily)
MARHPVTDRTDDRPLTDLLQQARPRLLGFLRRLCGADAEDVLQETLAKVWRLRGGFDPSRGGIGWLLQAAFRCFCDHRERQRRQPRAAAAHEVATASARETTCPIELQDELQRCLATLPPLERDLLLGFHAHGQSLRELAAEHRLPVNTVKSHLHRARARLAAFREDADDHT